MFYYFVLNGDINFYELFYFIKKEIKNKINVFILYLKFI